MFFLKTYTNYYYRTSQRTVAVLMVTNHDNDGDDTVDDIDDVCTASGDKVCNNTDYTDTMCQYHTQTW